MIRHTEWPYYRPYRLVARKRWFFGPQYDVVYEDSTIASYGADRSLVSEIVYHLNVAYTLGYLDGRDPR